MTALATLPPDVLERLSPAGQLAPTVAEVIAEKVETRRKFFATNPPAPKRKAAPSRSRVRPYHFKDNSPERAAGTARASLGARQGSPLAFPALIPAKPYCANFYENGLEIRWRASALLRRHVQFNRPNSIDWLLLDVDRPDAYCAAEDANLPAPTVVMINPENGHGHLAYLLKTPVHRFQSSSRRPIEFFAAIERGFRRRLNADRRYAGLLVKNPLHLDWRSDWQAFAPYSLEDLDGALDATDKRPEPRVERGIGEGRNVTAFNNLRQLGYREAVQHLDNMRGFRIRLEKPHCH